MGSEYSIQEVADYVANLKSDVQSFDRSTSSKHYKKLNKNLTEARNIIYSIKKSSSDDSQQKVCDQLSDEVSYCLEVLFDRANNKDELHNSTFYTKDNTVLKSFSYKTIILNIETSLPDIEQRVEEVLETKDLTKRNLLNLEIRDHLKNLGLIRRTPNTVLDNRINAIHQRLINCFEQLTNTSGDINEWLLHESQFHKKPINIGPLRLSNKKSENSQDDNESSSTSELDSLSTVSSHSFVDSKDDTLPPSSEVENNKGVNDNPLSDLECLLPHEKINYIREKLLEIKHDIDAFSEGYWSNEYTKIENRLLLCLDKIRDVEEQGNETTADSKQQYIDYINDLLHHLEEKAEETNHKQKCESSQSTSNPPVPIDSIKIEEELDDSFTIVHIHHPIIKPDEYENSAISLTEENNSAKQSIEEEIHARVVHKSDATADECLEEQIEIETEQAQDHGLSTNDMQEYSTDCPSAEKIDSLDISEESWNEEDEVSDSLNLYLLKRFNEHESSIQVDPCKGVSSELVADNVDSNEFEEVYIEKIKKILEDLAEIKILDRHFKKTNDYRMYQEIQDILVRVESAMAQIDTTVLDTQCGLLYSSAVKDLENYVEAE